ncbi:MAG: hypothetical protein R3D67_16805 [Hyphomicrobiaceae bacterium]
MKLLTVMLAPGSINHVANIVKGYAIAIGVVFGIYMVWQWWQTRVREAIIDRTARARSVWARHLGLALQNPTLAQPNMSRLSESDVPRYRVFVASQLASADEILALDPSDQWRDTLLRHLVPHKDYLASEDFRQTTLKDCSAETRSVLDRLARS